MSKMTTKILLTTLAIILGTLASLWFIVIALYALSGPWIVFVFERILIVSYSAITVTAFIITVNITRNPLTVIILMSVSYIPYAICEQVGKGLASWPCVLSFAVVGPCLVAWTIKIVRERKSKLSDT